MKDIEDEDSELIDLEKTFSSDELQDQVKRAQNELVQLRQRQNDIEKEKQRLEELSRQQEHLEKQRYEIEDKLNRSVILIQREIEEAQRRLEELNNIQNSFTEHLRNLEQIDANSLHGVDLTRELTHALGTVEEARSAYARSHAKIAPIDELDGERVSTGVRFKTDTEDHDFFYWLSSGFAFTLPLLSLGIFALIFWIWHLSSSTK